MKKSEINKLDKLFSSLIRSRGTCEWCGRTNGTFQCAHIFSRRFMNTRWNKLNALNLCAGCHRKAHDRPLEFADFVYDKLGKKKYLELWHEANVIGKKLFYLDIKSNLERT